MSIQDVMQAVSKRVPKRFEKMDLRFFTRIRLSDAYDGKGAPLDGVNLHAIMYGTRVVYRSWKMYNRGSGCGRGGDGDPSFNDFYRLSQTYLQILQIARAKYFSEPLPEKQPSGLSETRDQVIFQENDLEKLTSHPQYQSMSKQLRVLLTDLGDKTRYRVDVSKKHEQDNVA